MLVPETIPKMKLDRIVGLDVSVMKTSYDNWWNAMISPTFEGSSNATFIHPLDVNVMAGMKVSKCLILLAHR